MIRGLRAHDAPTLQRLCAADMKVFLRVGALLQAKLALSEAALAALMAEAGGSALLLDRVLREATPAEFTALAERHGVVTLNLRLVDQADGAEPGWRVLVLEDEVGNPLLAVAEAAADSAANAAADHSIVPTVAVTVANLTPALRGPVEGLLAARADDQRAAALEQLRYAAPPLALVGELMPMILADGAEVVRERAIGVLIGAGAHTAVVDLIRALIRRDDDALARLAEPVTHLPVAQLDLVVAAIMAGLARGQATQAVVDLCARLSTHLSTHRALDRLIEQLLPARLSLLTLVRALQARARARIDTILARALGLGAEQDATLIVLLAAPRAETAAPREKITTTRVETTEKYAESTSFAVIESVDIDRARLLDRGLELLLSTTELPRERMALAASLRRLDDGTLSARLAAAGMQVGRAADTSVYWLLAELCRDHAIDADSGTQLAGTLRHLLLDAAGTHLVAILEQQLPALLPAPDTARAALVDPLLEVLARYRDERTRDLVASALTGIGALALPGLWLTIAEHPRPHVRLLAIELLAELVPQTGDARAAADAVARLLTELQRVTHSDERAALAAAAARLSSAAVLDHDGEPARAVDAGIDALGDAGIDAVGFLAAGPHLDHERRAVILDRLLKDVAVELPDGPDATERDPATDAVTFILDDHLGRHTDTVPRLLAALVRIGQSPHTPAPLLGRLVNRLTTQWRQVASWRTIWGPGNVQELGRALGLLAERREFPVLLRLQISEALLPRINQLIIGRALARIFAHADGPPLSTLAGTAAEKLVTLAAEKYYADDEWEALAEVLVDMLAVPDLGPAGDSARRKLVNVLGSYRAHLSSRARAKLRFIATTLEPTLRERLDWA